MKVTPPPTSEAELLARCHAIAGQTLGMLAADVGVAVPQDLRRAKGWAGQVLEARLGADAQSLAEPDFRALGVELKTVPLDSNGKPKESTYVCTVPLEQGISERWEDCWVRRKLSRVLWLPIQADSATPVTERRIGTALLWSPDTNEEQLLRTDWEELMEMVVMGELEQISARMGSVMQIRPKAAHARVLTDAIGPEGERIRTNPRGFYLRPAFTAALLKRHYANR